MKSKMLVLMTALGLMLTSACIPSLFPLYSDADVVTDSRLIGTWSPPDQNEELWTFSASGDAYRLTVFDGDSCTPYEAHIVALGQFLFLDLMPIKPKFDGGMYDGLLLRLHTFFLIKVEEDRLEIAGLDLQDLKRQIEDGTISARLLEVDGDSVLAEPTPELQELVLEWAEMPGAFGDPEILLRR